VAVVALAAVAVQPWLARVQSGRNGYHPKISDSAAGRRPARSLGLIILAALSLPTTLFLLLGGAMAAVNPKLPVFRPAGEAAAFEFLREAARPGEVVLAAFETANALPAWAPVQVLVGHGPESANFAVRKAEVDAFFHGELGQVEQLRFLQENSIRYIFWGPAERRLGDWEPEPSAPVRRIYQAGEYSIFMVDAVREIPP
jgi:hypothetical protein